MPARYGLPSYHRSFGTTAQPLPLMEYDYDNGPDTWNQNADGYTMGCRMYAISHISGDIDDALYDPKKNYDRLCAWEGHPITQGGQIYDALTFAAAEGLLRVGETTEAQAQTHRRGQPFYVDKVPGMDWFDSHRIAMRNEKVPINIGTIWFQEWTFTPAPYGLMTANFAFDGTWDTEAGHSYELCGEKTINGEPAIAVLAWIGRKLYIGRDAFNRAFDIYGSASFIEPTAEPKDILFVELTILQHLVQLLSQYISNNLASKLPHYYQ